MTLTLPKVSFIGVLLDYYCETADEDALSLNAFYDWLLHTQNVNGAALDPNLYFETEKDLTMFLLRWKR